MTKRPHSDLKPVGDIVAKSLGDGFLGVVREIVKVFEVWGRAVGEYNARKTRPESIQNGRLTVIVESPVWIDHLGYFKAEFIKNINEALGAPTVEEIIFRVGVIPGPDRDEANRKSDPGGAKAPAKSVSPQVKKALSGVKDNDLRDAMVKLLARQNADPK